MARHALMAAPLALTALADHCHDRTAALYDEGGAAILMVGSDTWTGTGWGGFRTPAPDQNPPDMADFIRGQCAQDAKNLDQTTCDGLVEVGGATLVSFTYVTRHLCHPAPMSPGPSRPNRQARLDSGRAILPFVDPATALLMRREMREAVAHRQPVPSDDWPVTDYSYAPSIRVARPDETPTRP